MPGKITRIKNNITLKINRIKPFANMDKKHVITLVSVGNGINGAKWIAPEEELHVELMKQLNEHHPKLNIILVAGLLKRWNYWEMISHLSDEALIARLQDIPKDIDEKNLASILAEKFADIAKNLEEKYIKTLENHLDHHQKTIKSMKLPFKIASWEQRTHFDNCDKKSSPQSHIHETDDFMRKIESTKSRFLQNKKADLDKAKARMIIAQPALANLDFKKITDQACLQYILEEYYYFARLSHTEVLYPGKIPSALEPVFKESGKDLYWRDFSFKEAKNTLTEAKQPEETLTRARSSSFLESMSRQHNEPKTGSLAERRLKFLLSIQTTSTKKTNSDTPLEAKHPAQLMDLKNLSPQSSKRMMTFIDLFSKSPPSAEKELAMKKIEEATALLHIRY